MYSAPVNECRVNSTIMPAMKTYKQTACETERPQAPSSLHCLGLPGEGNEKTCSQPEFYGEVSMHDSSMHLDPIIMNVG